MSSQRENKLWESIRKWLTRVTGNKPEVILIIGLRLNRDNEWELDWKASHWLDDFNERDLPTGVKGAIVKEMVKDSLGDKLGDVVVNKGIPAIVNAIANKITGRTDDRKI